MRVSRPGELRFLDPAVLGRLGTMELKARTIVEGFLSGLHRSPLKGFSVEFAEYRQYFPGDELSTIDWKVYARTDRYYVKKFEEETNLRGYLLFDVSGSMAYAGEGRLSKLEYGSYLAASLAYLMHRQRDAAGLVTFDDRVLSMRPPSIRPGHLRSLLLALDQVAPGARTDSGPPLHQLADAISKRGLVVLISDLLDEPASVVDGLKHFRFRGSDVLVFHVLDPDERTFPFEKAARFRDLETDEELMTLPSAVRAEYVRAMDELIDRYRRDFGAAGIDYQLLDTSQPLDFALMAYLSARGRRQ